MIIPKVGIMAVVMPIAIVFYTYTLLQVLYSSFKFNQNYKIYYLQSTTIDNTHYCTTNKLFYLHPKITKFICHVQFFHITIAGIWFKIYWKMRGCLCYLIHNISTVIISWRSDILAANYIEVMSHINSKWRRSKNYVHYIIRWINSNLLVFVAHFSTIQGYCLLSFFVLEWSLLSPIDVSTRRYV